MSPREKRCLDFVTAYLAGEGYSPSFEEIRAGMGFRSTTQVARLVDGLVRQGLLFRIPNKHRSLSLQPFEAPGLVSLYERTEKENYQVKIRQAGEVIATIANRVKNAQPLNYWELQRAAEYFKNVDQISRKFAWPKGGG